MKSHNYHILASRIHCHIMQTQTKRGWQYNTLVHTLPVVYVGRQRQAKNLRSMSAMTPQRPQAEAAG